MINTPAAPVPVPLDDVTALVWSLRNAEAHVRQWRDAADELRRILVERLGDAEVGTIDGQPVVKHTIYTDTRVSTKMLRELAPPELIEQCKTTTTRRRFTLAEADGGAA